MFCHFGYKAWTKYLMAVYEVEMSGLLCVVMASGKGGWGLGEGGRRGKEMGT